MSDCTVAAVDEAGISGQQAVEGVFEEVEMGAAQNYGTVFF